MELVTEKYKQTEVGLIPNDWEVKEFGELTEKIIGGRARRRHSQYIFMQDGHCTYNCRCCPISQG